MRDNGLELVYELSPMQQAMLFSSLYAPGTGVYVLQTSLRLTGRLDIPAFERAWRHVFARHGVLRTGFYWEDLEKPVQVVYRDVPLDIRRESWRELDAEAQAERLRAFLDADRERGFELGDPPLMRLALFDRGEGDWQFVWTLHHLLLDGWSQGALLKELFTCYASYVRGETPALPRPQPYRDYIAWLQRQDPARTEAFWRQSLAGLEAPTLLAGGDGRTAAQAGFRDARRARRLLPAEATAALRDLARRNRLTLNTLVQGGWSALLAHATGGEDVVFGSTVAGRPAELPGVESILGLFINTLPVRVPVTPELRLLPWLTELQRGQVEARRFEHAPLFEVQTWSGLPAGVALFDHILVFESFPWDSGLLGGLPDLSLSGFAANELTSYPVYVVVIPGERLSLEIAWDSARFDAGQAARLLEHLAGALQAMARPGFSLDARTVGDLPLLLDGERHRLLVEDNDTRSAFPRAASVPALFAEHVAASPEALAVIDGEERWTYLRLDAEADRLARHLVSLGVEPGARVGVAMERSAGMLVALLAILKAGAAYVPLDPGYPDDRLLFMLEDTAASVVVVQESTRGRLAALEAPVRLVGPGEESEAKAELPRLSRDIPAEALALVIFTSGSTGRPKGVAIQHRGIARLVRDTHYAWLGGADRVTHLSNTSFDAATWEIWAPLLNGSTLVVVPREVALSPESLRDLVRRERVTVVFLTTALFNQVAREAPDTFSGLRYALFGGEAADPAAVSRALEAGRPEQVLHMYGPAESTTYATWHRVREVAPGAATVPIGQAVTNTSIYVVDRWRRPVPAGTPGELLVGGDGLACGYLNRPALTAERFVPNPWAEGERLYRTGDLVRARPDGALEFLGRIDNQVKIRGLRIEPGEIEAVLAGHPELRECAVLARRDDPRADLRLVAYVVAAAGQPLPRTDALRAWLRERLPDYMVPAVFVPLERLPLTPNGKVDRKALPAPEPERTEMDGGAAPADPIEELLAGIWSDVLRCGRVGAHDDFFALGGHSLLATQVVSRIRAVFGVELPLRGLFEAPTVAGLAELIRREAAAGAPPILPVPRDGDLPLSFGQQRLWFLDQLEPGSSGYNVPAAVRLRGDLHIPRLAAVFAEIVRRHEVLRTTFAARDGKPVQIISPPDPALSLLPVIDLSALGAEREDLARALARVESLRPFDLQVGPLLRLALIRLDACEHLLLLTMHHIVSDGWSIGVLVREVQALYRALGRGERSPLPELPVQYADFAAWQRQWLSGDVLEAQLAAWRDRLAGTTGVLELPTDRPRPAMATPRGAEHLFALHPELSRRIGELARSAGATPFMVLAAGLFALLSRRSGQTDLNLGSPVANRNRGETEGLIGFFVNMLVLRGSLRGIASFADLLRQVRETSLAAYTYQDLPFERLVDELQPERDPSRSPLVQVTLAVNSAVLTGADLEGLSLLPEDPPAETAKFDLAFSFSERREGGYAGALQYSTDLYDPTTAVRLAAQLAAFLDALTGRPEAPLADLAALTAAERHQVLLEWNDTRGESRAGLLHQLFEASVDARPEALAAVWEGISWSYGELEGEANRLAHLLAGLGVKPGSRVGVWMERSLHMLAAVLGILKAGGTYVPLDAAWPAERVETILAGMDAPVVVADRTTLPAVEEMRWRLPRLADAVCPDVATAEPGPEAVDTESVRSLWDFVAERSTDRVTAGGFVSSFTGLPFLETEVDEYRDRVLSLAAPWLRPDARVLEVGCGAGLILWEMARRVERCVGIDPSALTQERNREQARAAGLDHVELPVGFAHEIGGLFAEGSFDLVLLASTVQFFPGPRYLEAVVKSALRLLAPGGALLIADVMDARRQEDFRSALAAAGVTAKQGERELWLDEDLFRDFGAALPDAGEAEVLHRTVGFANELGYRYDVLLRREDAPRPRRERRKRLWTGWHLKRRASSRPAVPSSPADIAYVIHTSGSTGAPKGIAVQHAPAVALVDWVNRSFGVGADDRLLFVTSLCFDLSVYDLFGTLAAGGTVHVASEEALRAPERLVRTLRDEPVTIWNSAPAALQQLAPLFPSAVEGRESRLRLVLLSGDWIPVPLPDRVRAAFPGARVVSLGGATEATVWSNWYPVDEVDARWPSIPYGRPITDARYLVLDAGLQPCPIGVPGDLYIGGRCLCVGYTGQPELTAASFLPDPFTREEPGARLYRTGDRARFFRDGNLEFLGRVDQQVKVRGYRIELGEIEVALVRHPGVREAVVLVREDRPGDPRLVAYAVPRERAELEVELEANELRAWLAEKLPSYMVPSAFVLLDALPVTANGKLDRKALPAPEWGGADEESYVAPSDPVEQTLADLWAEILGLERVGVRDNFFTLGGHSLLATQLLSRIRGALDVELALRHLFEAPTIEQLARTVRGARRERAPLTPPPIVPIPREGDLPLSFAQQRLWLLDQLEPGSPAYNIPSPVRLRGDLPVPLLARIFAEVVRRHEALRTTFAAPDGRPVQVIAAEGGVELPVVDLSGLPEAEREERARGLALEEGRRPFDLAAGPLLRLTLVRLAARDHLLLMTVHHIVSDGWSMGVLLREIAVLYAAFSQGETSPLPGLPVQYADFAAWQRGWLQGEVLEAQLGFWREQLAGAPAVLELPTDRPRPAVQTHRGGARLLTLSPALSAAVRDLCLRERVTPFMALLAAWGVLLGRHAGQEEVVLGSPIAGRNRRETEELIGFFVNTLVLRVDLKKGPDFGALLGCVRRVALDAFAHQDVPFERLVEELVAERDLSRSPLFQAFFALQNAPGASLDVPGLTISPLPVESGLAKFDLSLTLWETEDGFAGGLEHNADLFDGSTAERFLARFAALLEAAAAAPGTPVADLPLLLAAERQQALVEWNDTETVSETGCLHELFFAQAARTPQAVALVHGHQRLTYAELAARAGGLARHLRALGIGPESRVAVCLERSADLIASLLGVLAAGGAYVPVDPAYPLERRTLMLTDSEAAVLVTRGWLAEGLPATGARLLDLDAGEVRPAERPPEVRVTPRHLAYVIYTSGSTGRPKGVAIEHRSAVAMATWARTVFDAEELSGMLAATSVCFDLSVFEIFVPLAWGGTVLLAENALELPNLPAAAEVRLVNTVPSAAAALVRTGGLPASVRTVNLAGEPLPAALAERLYATGTVQRVLNLYGPSEDTTYSTGSQVPRQAERAPSIGRPLHGTRAWVIDRQGAQVPPGVAGELWLAGAGLARGYLGRPELTAERFTPDPFGGAGERVYRTGDLVRHRTDGELDFLGRIDHQVKVRGFRIELGEIEAVLARHPAVRDCAVLVRPDTQGTPLLVAYVAGSVLEPRDLRAFLATRLPDHMVPTDFVVLDALPLSPNGKVDRRALPAPGRARLERTAEIVLPRNPTEQALAEIWKELLGLEQVGVEDGFFELGGHSLLATQALARIRRTFGVDLPLREVFNQPTVAALAELIDRLIGSRAPQPAEETDLDDILAQVDLLSDEEAEAWAERLLAGEEPVEEGPVEEAGPARDPGPPPLSFAQQRLWLLDQIEPGNPAYNIPLPVRLSGELPIALLARIFAEITRRHEALRTTFATRDGVPVQVIHLATGVELPVVDLSALPEAVREERAHEIAAADARRPFDLQRGPLLRLTLVRLAAREHLLLITTHHIISDAWSTGVLLREVGALYEAFAQGRPSPLPALPLQYADFAVWQREWLRGEVLETQLAFWKRQLDGAPAALDLPADRPRPAAPSYRGASQTLTLPAGLSDAVRDLCRRERVTPFMALLAAWAVLLGRHADQEDVLLGTPIAGRNREEIEGLIGFFANTLVLRVDQRGEQNGGPGFRELLGRVRQTALDAFSAQDVPFEKLVEELVPTRDVSRSPLFQAMFVLQAPLGTLQIPGLTVRPVPLPGQTSKFDLLLNMGTTGEGDFAGDLEYSTDLFDEDRMVRLLQAFRVLLGGIVTEPERSVRELPLLTAVERTAVLATGSGPAVARPAVCVHEPVEEQAERSPDALAAVWPEAGGVETGLTYRGLNRRANQLAHHLRALGVGPDDRVALCFDRSLDLLVAVLGVLKAGGAYVPVDPAYPAERVAYMLSDSRSRVLVTSRETAGRLPEHGIPRILVEDIANQSEENPPRWTTPDHLAYVIYTSGSTGRPKGVAMPHAVLANLLFWQREASSPGAGSRTLQLASLSFDVSFQEIFSTWWTGGAVVAVPQETRRDAGALCRVLDLHGVTRLFLPFVALQQLAEAIDQGAPVPWALTEVVTAGEQLRITPQIERWMERSGVALENQYGPSEGHVVTAHRLSGPAAQWPALPPIGRPLPNVRMLVLDRHLQPVPPGVPGHLCFGGAPVVRGYLDHPELTAERFLPDPFAAEPGARLYATGDRARFQTDGTLQFLGRIDHQVKVRGFRVEPGEVEAALTRHPGVREAAVVVRGDRLAGYWVGDPELSERSLRAALAAELPEHMVPALFVRLDELPLTASGKLRRDALPDPQGTREIDDSYAAPSTAVEELLAGIWAEVLKRDRVGVHDDFFALGGHSLLGTQVVSRIRSVLGVEPPLRQLFETPTVAGFARALHLEERTGVPAERILRTPRNGDLPLSFAQQRLWFLDQLEPGSAAYNIPSPVRLSGALPVPLLARVFAEVVRRHEALRTTFASREGWPVQVIAAELRPELPVVDLSGLPEAEREERAREIAAAEARRPFDLQRGPLLRLTLVRLAESEHLLLMTVHHIVADGWSMGVLLREIAVLQEAFSQGAPSPLAELPIQYADFAAWQRGWLQGEVLESQLAFWRERLAGAPALLELPADRPRPARQTYRGGLRPLALPAALSAAVRDLCLRERVTPFMALLAAWAVLLSRHAGQEDVVLGSPIAGRHRRETEELIGLFVNTLALRVDLGGAPGFGELLGRVRRLALDAFAHQDLPFERLVEELVADRDLSRSPLFQALFVLQNAPRESLAVPGLTLAPVPVESGVAKLDLSLTLWEESHGFAGALEHNADLFDGSTAERFLARFLALLQAAAASPATAVTDLPLLLEAERQQALVEWTTTGMVPPPSLCLHELFFAQAERTPHAVALVHGGERWTYERLAARAGGVARRLREMGVGPETRVAVCLERSVDLIASLLGVLAAGGAYVPVDPAYPLERRELMLADSGAAVLVTRGRLAERLPATSVRRLDLDADPVSPAEEPSGTGVTPDHLAYVIYTSGSTGRPKGVAIEHRSAVALATWARTVFSAEELSGVLAATSVCFDLSVFEIFVPLAWGGTVLLAENALELPKLPAAPEVRLLNTVPSAAATLVRTGGLPSSVRTVNLAGEPLPAALAERLYATGTVERVLNLYGPSEDTTYSTGSLVPWNSDRAPAIGRPLTGTRAWVVDHRGEPVPPGVVGELWLAGSGLARGYLGRPELTAERFTPDGLGQHAGQRVYRTGDLVRHRADGELEFLGRIDHQVKVRGFRIELGEIETALGSHPAVRDCAVAVREDAQGSHFLVACLVSDPGSPAEAGELRDFLGSRLPAPMVPTHFVVLEALPLAPNGKVDRRALPAPDPGRRERKGGVVPPRTRTEETLAAIWKELLGLEQVSVEDSFFELGGHSLLATQVLARLHRELGVELPLRDVFQRPTIAGLAELIDNRLAVPLAESELAALLEQVDGLSDEEVRAMLDGLLSPGREEQA